LVEVPSLNQPELSARLGAVEIHLEFITAAEKDICGEALIGLSARMAMRLNSLIAEEVFD
jgi:hypothetical protein